MRINVRVTEGNIRDLQKDDVWAYAANFAEVSKVFHNQTYISVGLKSFSDYDTVLEKLNGAEISGFTLTAEISKKRPANETENPRADFKGPGQSLLAWDKDMTAYGGPSGSGAASEQNLSAYGYNSTGSGYAQARTHKDNIYYAPGQMKLSVFRAFCSEDEIQGLFEPHTYVHEIFCSGNKYAKDQSGEKTYFVKVDDVRADYVVQKLNGNQINGQAIKIEYHKPNNFRKTLKGHPNAHQAVFTKMVLFDISEDATEKDIELRFQTFSDVKEVMISNRGGRVTAFVHVLPEAVSAIDEYFNVKMVPFFGKQLKIKVSKDSPAPRSLLSDPGNLAQGWDHPNQNRYGNQAAPQHGLLNDPTPNPGNQMGMMTGFGGMNNMNMMNMYQQNMMMHNNMKMMMMQGQGQGSGPGLLGPSGCFGMNKPSWSGGQEQKTSLEGDPKDQEEVNELLKRQEELSVPHPYEKFLASDYEGQGELPSQIPPPSYFELLKERTQVKMKIDRALKLGFNTTNRTDWNTAFVPNKKPKWLN